MKNDLDVVMALAAKETPVLNNLSPMRETFVPLKERVLPIFTLCWVVDPEIRSPMYIIAELTK